MMGSYSTFQELDDTAEYMTLDVSIGVAAYLYITIEQYIGWSAIREIEVSPTTSSSSPRSELLENGEGEIGTTNADGTQNYGSGSNPLV